MHAWLKVAHEAVTVPFVFRREDGDGQTRSSGRSRSPGAEYIHAVSPLALRPYARSSVQQAKAKSRSHLHPHPVHTTDLSARHAASLSMRVTLPTQRARRLFNSSHRILFLFMGSLSDSLV
jgi:hypothetical protein